MQNPDIAPPIAPPQRVPSGVRCFLCGGPDPVADRLRDEPEALVFSKRFETELGPQCDVCGQRIEVPVSRERARR